MENLILPKQYKSELNLHDTQLAIKTVKDFFQALLAQRLHLTRVSAPLFVDPATGLNDNLNGYERPVTFGIKEQDDKNAEVVHSLAKWKRYALKKYGFQVGEGIYTDMNAIRRDESTDNIHSIFVDQWDWEKIIDKEDRNLDYLKETVRTVYKCLRKTEQYMAIQYDYIDLILPKEIFFITSQELEDLFPDNTPKEREYYITKAKGAVCIGRGIRPADQNACQTAERVLSAAADRHRDRRGHRRRHGGTGAADGGDRRLDPDNEPRHGQLLARQRHPGSGSDAALSNCRQAKRHQLSAGRPCEQGRRHRRTQGAGAHCGRGADVRGGPLADLPDSAGSQKPVRINQ